MEIVSHYLQTQNHKWKIGKRSSLNLKRKVKPFPFAGVFKQKILKNVCSMHAQKRTIL